MLTDRQRLILNAIIDDYIRSAEPVGSRSISKRGDVNYSPATIRNEMSDLEELGYLEQPHTSAGRVPSQKGYRYYVDHLVQLGNISNDELQRIQMFFAERVNEIGRAIQHAASILSTLTNYTSIVLGPEMFSAFLRHLQLLPLSDGTAVAIVVTNTGHVENRVVAIPDGVSSSELEQAVNLLNSKLAGVPFYKLKSKLYSEVAQEMGNYITRCEELLRIVENVLDNGDDQRLYLSGTTNMLIQPEFKDVDKVKTVLDLLDETHTMIRMFAEAPDGIRVRIGMENGHEAIANCSLITATYSVEGQTLGTIGILGPTRMEYGRVISLLDYLSKDLAVMLGRWYK